MKLKFISLLLLSSIFFSSCDLDGNGKKIKVSDRTEVYIKNDATEADARKMGNYFDSTWKEQTNEKSFQLSKDSGNYTVRMVIDTTGYEKDSSLNESFMAIQFLIQDQIFKGSKVKLILTDNKFNDFKTIDGSSSPYQSGNADNSDSVKVNN